MTASVSIDVEQFQRRLQHLFQVIWGPQDYSFASKDELADLKSASQCSSLLFTLGTAEDHTVYQKTTAIFNWLLGYEFSETIMLISRASDQSSDCTCTFLCSKSKGNMLDVLSSSGKVTILKREKEAGSANDMFAQLLQSMTSNGSKVGIVQKDRNEGPMVDEWTSFLASQSQLELTDVSPAISFALTVKDDKEMAHVRMAADITSKVYAQIGAKRLLTVIDSQQPGKTSRWTHSRIADDIEDSVLNRERMDRIDLQFDHTSVDICYPPIVQSRSAAYSLKASAMSTDDPLATTGAVLLSTGIRYHAYCANMARTFLVDPSPMQEEALTLLYDMQSHLISMMKPGVALCDVYAAAVSFLQSRRPDWIAHLPSSLGFAMGLEFRQSEYLISPRSTRNIHENMVFNLILGLQDLHDEHDFAVQLSDTVFVSHNLCSRLTVGYDSVSQVSFSSSSSTAGNSAIGNDADGQSDLVTSGPRTRSTRMRTAQSTTQASAARATERKEHQRSLGQQRTAEALQRYGSDAAANASSGGVDKIVIAESYRKETALPKDLASDGKAFIYLDRRSETVIVPVFNRPLAVHIAHIKNATKTDEPGGVSFIRLNLQPPPAQVSGASSKSSSSNVHFLRGLTVRVNGEPHRAQEIVRAIQEMKKAAVEKEAAAREAADLVEQRPLMEVGAGRRPLRLVDVQMRPPLQGSGSGSNRRQPGDVELHANGLRYRSQLHSDQRVDVLFSNIRHLIMQPCDNEPVVLVHVHLHHPLVVNKKKTWDIQFYREAMDSLVDETTAGAGGAQRRSRMRFGDEDEIEQEREERKRRDQANEEFRRFAQAIVDASRGSLSLDEPIRELGFMGVPHRQSVLLQPTTDCLVQLVEPPLFLITLADVEVVFLERVVFGLKNFDLAFVMRDHSKPVVHVTSIPMDQLEGVKDWLDGVDVYFVESRMNFNWTNILKTVNEDPVGFYEMGGWTYLQPDEALEGSDAEDAEDSDASSQFEDEDEFEESDEEDDEEFESDEDDYDEDEDDEEESDFDDDDDDEEGMDWDELEEQARADDERARGKSAPVVVGKKRAAAAPVRKSAPSSKRR